MTNHDATVDTLRAVMLECLLAGIPLPGTDSPVAFPDLGFIRAADRILIADDNVAPAFSLDASDKPVEVLNENEIRALARREGDCFYVYFQPGGWTGNRARVALEVRMAPAQPDVHMLGLGGVSAVFEKRDGEWIVIEDPLVMAI